MLSGPERDRVEAAVREAERATSGEIVVVLARQAASYRSVPLLYGLVGAILAPPLLIGLTGLSAARIFVAQFGIALLLVALSSAFPLRLVPASVKRARAREAASREFVGRGMADTRGRTGVLLYVAAAERYAEVVGDVTISGRVSEAEWQGVIDALVTAMAAGRTADALVAAVGRIGEILARHVPPGADDRDELPNRIVLV